MKQHRPSIDQSILQRYAEEAELAFVKREFLREKLREAKRELAQKQMHIKQLEKGGLTPSTSALERAQRLVDEASAQFSHASEEATLANSLMRSVCELADKHDALPARFREGSISVVTE